MLIGSCYEKCDKTDTRSLLPVIPMRKMLDFVAGRMAQKIWAGPEYRETIGIYKNKAESDSV